MERGTWKHLKTYKRAWNSVQKVKSQEKHKHTAIDHVLHKGADMSVVAVLHTGFLCTHFPHSTRSRITKPMEFHISSCDGIVERSRRSGQHLELAAKKIIVGPNSHNIQILSGPGLLHLLPFQNPRPGSYCTF